MSAQAFDTLAATYDQTFSHTPLGQLLREATWRRIDAVFASGSHILEIGCGTGEDAIHLARRGVQVTATDASGAMVDATRHKADAAGVSASVSTAVVDVATVATADLAPPPMLFDGVLANFGSLNCVADLERVSAALAAVTRPGGTLIAVVMGPVVPWEWAWYLAHRSPRRAVRRLTRSTEWRGLTIRYPSVPRFRRSFAASWQPGQVRAIGVALPPSYVDGFMRRHPRFLATLASVENTIGQWPVSARIADHYLIELVRR